jgi:transcriptional regulator with XRE-family HTH domain
MVSTELPNRIREWRNRRRLSLAELGEAVGLSRSEISKLESGSRRVRADHLMLLAGALQVSPFDLVDQNSVRELMGDTPAVQSLPTPSPAARTIPIFQARRQGKSIILSKDRSGMQIDSPPQLAGVPAAYAFYMPDTSREPRVPVGALLYVHPLLPPRLGDLAVILQDGVLAVLASVDRGDGGLVATTGDAILDLQDQAVTGAERIVGMWFP